MASIATSIQIIDRVTAPINNIIKALDNMCSAYESIQDSMNTGFNTGAIEEARQAINSAAQQVLELKNNQNEVNNSISKGKSEMDGLVGKIMGAAAAYASFQSVSKLLDTSDELVQTKARIDMMNDGLQSTDDLMNTIYASAQDARGSFSDMAAVVAKFGNNAGDAFDSSEEVIAFSNIVQKQMTIAGASTAEASNAMLQLSQALGSGVLRGDELNSIFEQAPNLIQSIAEYLDVPIGSIRQMASEGQLTADIVKAAIFASADEVNTKFEEMPMTWNQVFTSMKNTALMAFEPVLMKISEIANSDEFQIFAQGMIEVFANVASILFDIIELVTSIASFFINNWSIISPIIWGIVAALIVYNSTMGVAWLTTLKTVAAKIAHAGAIAIETTATFIATAAQHGLNAALAACPLTWIIILVIALIAVIVAVCNWIAQATGVTQSGLGIITGALGVAVAFIGNLFVSLINAAIDIFVGLWNFIAAFANFFANVFNDPVGSIARLFFDLVDTILSLLETVASTIDTLFGSNLADSVAGWRKDLDSWVDKTFGQGEEIMATVTGDDWKLDRFSYGDAFDKGAELGDGLSASLSDMFSSGDEFDIPGSDDYSYDYENASNLKDINQNTEDTASALSITSEDLKYLRDIAEKDTINRFTTAEVNVNLGGVNNTVNNNADLDGVVDYLASSVAEALDIVREGVDS